MAAKPPDKAAWKAAQFAAKHPQFKSRSQVSAGVSLQTGCCRQPYRRFMHDILSQATPGKAPGPGGSPAASPAGGSPAAPADASDNLLAEAKRAKAQRATFRETDVLSERGVWRLYDSFQRLPLSGKAGHEAADMARIAGLYDDWARQLAPGLHPTDVLTKCR